MSSQQHGGGPGGRGSLAAARRGRAPDRGLETTLRPLVADAVGTLGFDLEALDVNSVGRRRLVKVVVDADDGVGLDRLPEVSRVVAATLDDHDEVLAGPYTLEVTSPGVDRPLTRPRHWKRAKLRLVRIRRHDGTEYTARVGQADDSGAEVLVNGELRRVEYASVAKAVVEVEFRQPPSAELLLLEGRDPK